MISADINRKIIDDKGKELDQLSADTILVSFLKQHIGWITAIDNELTKSRFEFIKPIA